MALVLAAAKDGDHAKGLAHLDQLAGALEGKRTRPPIQTGAAAFNTVEFRKGLLAWDSARKFAAAQMRKLRDAILSDPEAKAAPDWPELQKAANDLEGRLEKFQQALDNALIAANGASDEKVRRDQLKRAASLIAVYQQHLNTEPLFTEMDNGAYGSFNVHATMTKTLAFLAGKLGV